MCVCVCVCVCVIAKEDTPIIGMLILAGYVARLSHNECMCVSVCVEGGRKGAILKNGVYYNS